MSTKKSAPRNSEGQRTNDQTTTHSIAENTPGVKMLKAALAYGAMGWPIIPLHAVVNGRCTCKKGAQCETPGKHPRIKDWENQATTDADKIRRFWASWPNANIGLACGPADVLVVDLDERPDYSGKETWRDLGIDDSGAVIGLTPSGGQHLLFKRGGRHIGNTVGELGEGIDTRGEGGLIVLAPSNHILGEYVWDVGAHPSDRIPGEIPQTLVDRLRNLNGANGKRQAAAPIPDRIPKGQRNKQLCSLAGSMRNRGADEATIRAAIGVMNLRCDPPLPESALDTIAHSIAKYKVGSYFSAKGDSTVTVPISDYPQETEGDNFLLTAGAHDEGNAQCLNRIYKGRFLHCGALGWLAYNGRHWDRENASAQLDRATVDTLKQRQHRAVDAEKSKLVAAATPSSFRVHGCESLFRSLVTASVSDFDGDPDLLNCRNGVVDLRTGVLTPHEPGQRFTYCLPTDYNPEADRRPWVDFLDSCGLDQDKVDFLQTSLGYSSTGHTSEEILFYLQGRLRAGKGVFIETVKATLGDMPLATEVDFSTFTMDRGQGQKFDLAGLRSCRFVAASESTKYGRLNAQMVKRVTGGNEIQASFKHRDVFAYRPQFKIWLSSNYPANVDPDDDAAWYRLRVIEFPNSFAGNEDKSLKERLRQPAVLEGVLAWIVEGARFWYGAEQGLAAPPEVTNATAEARDNVDMVGQWLAECIQKTGDPNDFVQGSTVYHKYENWCDENGVTPKKKKGLTQAMNRQGYQAGASKKRNGKTVRGCEGIRLV